MYAHNLPMHRLRALAPHRLAAGVFVTLALLSAACSNDPASRINSPSILSSSNIGSSSNILSFAAAFVPSLGTAANFAALGGTGVTCTTPNPPLPAVTIRGGDVGSGSVASTTVTGFPNFTPGAKPCSLDPGRTPLLGQTAAITDLITAYNALRDNNPCPSANASHNLVGNLVSGSQGSSLEPGVYCITETGLLTSQLTLNGGGNSNAVWIFRAASDLTPKNGSVVMAGGGNPCNVYWQIGTAVDLLNTAFVGNVLAGTAITFTGAAPPGTASSLVGRALAMSDVTMTGANITACAAGNGKGDDDGDKDHHDKDHHDKDKDHGGDKGDKDKDHRGDHGDGRGGHDG
jgi:hypothetical protein